LPFAELDETGKYIEVTTSYPDRYLIRMMPGTAWRSEDKHWRVPRSWAACVVLRQLFGQDLELGGQLVAWARDRCISMTTAEPVSQQAGHGSTWKRLKPGTS
jgi:hypothetical protein